MVRLRRLEARLVYVEMFVAVGRTIRFEAARRAAAAPPTLAGARQRNEWRAIILLSEILLEQLRASELGPASRRVLRDAETARSALAAIPDTRELRAADEAMLDRAPPDPADRFAGQLDIAADRYRAGQPLDRVHATPVELLAWCLVREERRRAAAVAPPALEPPDASAVVAGYPTPTLRHP